jgi:FkbM family methyltransferase
MSLLARLVKDKRKNALLERLPDDVVVRAGAIAMALTSVPELRLLKHLVDPLRHAVDVGANRGIFAYALSLHARSVTAYEPNPLLAERIRRLGLSHVEVRQKALSNTIGEAELTIPLVDGRHLDTRASFHLGDAPGERIRVPLARLDDEGLKDVGFIKIDVEGHEEDVLRGATTLIRRDRPSLLVEIEQRFTTRDIRDMFRFIESLGYRGAFLSTTGLVPLAQFDVENHQTRFLPDVLHADYVNNFVFRPLERR